MATIHVIFDPRDVVRHPGAEELRNLKVSHTSMALADADLTNIDVAAIANDLAKRLLARLSRKQ